MWKIVENESRVSTNVLSDPKQRTLEPSTSEDLDLLCLWLNPQIKSTEVHKYNNIVIPYLAGTLEKQSLLRTYCDIILSIQRTSHTTKKTAKFMSD